MLVLSRKQKQQIKIGDDVVITVLQIKGGSVRLGIEAPREVHVMRAELNEFREPVPVKSTTDESLSGAEREKQPIRGFADPTSEIAEDGVPELAEELPATDDGKVFELKIHGVEDGTIAPTRLSEIVNSVVQS